MDKILFTPGPLTTSRTVKEAMLRDVGARDVDFIELVRSVRTDLLRLASTSQDEGYEAVLVQGSGTFGLEAVLASALPPAGALLAVVNGAYGERMRLIATTLGIPTHVVQCPETEAPEPEAVRRALIEHPEITHVTVVHCETTTGILNPIEAIGEVVSRAGVHYIVDSMSALGAIPVDVAACGIDYLVSSSNKCIEGVPGFSFVICRRSVLLESEGWARSFSLDLLAQWRGLETSGQFRFTPPTHAILAFEQALRELREEGGVEARARRYRDTRLTLVGGMSRLGFREVLARDVQSDVITAFYYLEDPAFDFAAFYTRLSDKGFVIYPGKLGEGDAFRIGSCGRIDSGHVRGLLEAMRTTLREMGVALPS